jgi:hypothetical protein
MFLLLLLSLCAFGNYAWLQHIDSGWGSENALKMFKIAFPLAVVGVVGGVIRRVRDPSCVDPDSDDEDSDEEFDELNSDAVRRNSMTAKGKAVGLIREAAGKPKKKLANHTHKGKGGGSAKKKKDN